MNNRPVAVYLHILWEMLCLEIFFKIQFIKWIFHLTFQSITPAFHCYFNRNGNDIVYNCSTALRLIWSSLNFRSRSWRSPAIPLQRDSGTVTQRTGEPLHSHNTVFFGMFPHDVKMYNRPGAREHLQNSFVVCFITQRCQMGGVCHIKAHNECYEI